MVGNYMSRRSAMSIDFSILLKGRGLKELLSFHISSISCLKGERAFIMMQFVKVAGTVC